MEGWREASGRSWSAVCPVAAADGSRDEARSPAVEAEASPLPPQARARNAGARDRAENRGLRNAMTVLQFKKKRVNASLPLRQAAPGEWGSDGGEEESLVGPPVGLSGGKGGGPGPGAGWGARGLPGRCLGAEMPESGTPGRLDHVPKNEARGGILSGRVGSPSVGPVGWNEILPPPGAFLLPTGPLPVRAAGIGRGTFSVQVTR